MLLSAGPKFMAAGPKFLEDREVGVFPTFEGILSPPPLFGGCQFFWNTEKCVSDFFVKFWNTEKCVFIILFSERQQK